MRQQIHTPEGVRDIYGVEYQRKLVLEDKLQKVLHLYGYHDIQTPMFEYFDVFGKEIGTIQSKELYKFFDREGDTLVLRPDITPSIARVVTTVYEKELKPVRLCYKGNTFVNHSNYLGKLRENTQLGAEFIGENSEEADAEMIAMAVESLKEVGLNDFQIHIGHVGFFEGLIQETQLSEEDERLLRELIHNRNYFGVDELLERSQAKITTKTAFQNLPELIGGVEILRDAKKIALNFKILEAVKRLEQVYKLLVAYGVEKYVTFDLSMSGTFGYYTGIIFRGYTHGTGDAIVKGGRYDNLVGKFGENTPSIGFAIVIDELLNSFGRQKIRIVLERKTAVVLYDEERILDAISLTKDFRAKGKQVEMIKKEPGIPVSAYIGNAKNSMCGSLLYMKKSKEIEMFNFVSGESKIVTIK